MREQLERFLQKNTTRGTLPEKLSIVLVGEQARAAERDIRAALDSVWQGYDVAFFAYQEAFQVSSLAELGIDALRSVHEQCERWAEEEGAWLCIVVAADCPESLLVPELAKLAGKCHFRSCYDPLECAIFALVPSEMKSREKASAVRGFFKKLYAMQEGRAQPIRAWLRYLEDQEPEELHMELDAKVFLLERKHKIGSGVVEKEPFGQMEPLAYLLGMMDRCVRGCYLPVFEADDIPDQVKLLALMQKRVRQLLEEQPAEETGSLLGRIEHHVKECELRGDDFTQWMNAVCVYQSDPTRRDRLSIDEQTEEEFFGSWLKTRYESWVEQIPTASNVPHELLRNVNGDQLTGYLEELNVYLAAPERGEPAVRGERSGETTPRTLRTDLIERLYMPRYRYRVDQRIACLAEETARMIRERLRDGDRTCTAFLREVSALLQERRTRLDVNGFLNAAPEVSREWLDGFRGALSKVLAGGEPDYRQLFEYLSTDPGMAVRVGSCREWCCRISGVECRTDRALSDSLEHGDRQGQRLKVVQVMEAAENGHQAAESFTLDHLTFWRML